MEGKSTSELLLEAVRILIWPCMVAFGLILYSDTVVEILTTRKVRIGDLEIGDKVSSLEEALQSQLQGQVYYLNEIKDNKNNALVVEKYVSLAMNSIESARVGVKNAVKTIQDDLPQGSGAQVVREYNSSEKGVERVPVGSNRSVQAKAWETVGFKYVLDKDVDNAIKYFSQAEAVWPEYHNVAELKKLLSNSKKELEQKQSARWNEIYKIILSRYSWGMPTDMLKAMQQAVG